MYINLGSMQFIYIYFNLLRFILGGSENIYHLFRKKSIFACLYYYLDLKDLIDSLSLPADRILIEIDKSRYILSVRIDYPNE
jgi:hypothetical protein